MLPRLATISLHLLAGIIGSILLFVACLAMYDRHNDQPAHYHPDEPGKGLQILERAPRNHNHPQLMLEVAQWVIAREQTPQDLQSIVIAGRRGSAYLAAAAVVLCAWAGLAATRSWFGFLMGAVGAGLCPALLAHSRFFKEDASLIFGMSCVLAAGAALAARRWPPALMLLLAFALGAACGVAASGKYAGVMFLVPSLVLVLVVTVGRWWLMPLLPILLISGALWSWTGINHRAVEDWDNFLLGLEGEARHAQTEHSGLTMDMPNLYFVDLVWREAMPHVKVLACCAPLALLLQRRSRGDRWPPSFGWWLILCGGVYLLALSYSVLPFYRYALPVTVMLYLLAGLSVVWLIQGLELPPLWRGGATAGLLTLVLLLQGGRCLDYDRQFANDSRDNLHAWASQALPPYTRVVADTYTALRGVNRFPSPTATRLRVISPFFAADVGTVEELQARGYTYVAVASSNYDRFFSPYTRPTDDRDSSYDRRRRFYRTLFEKHPVVWQQTAEHPMWTFANPDITVFRIAELPSALRNR